MRFHVILQPDQSTALDHDRQPGHFADSKRLRSGTTQQFDATASLSDGTSATVNSLVNWSSSNPGAVTLIPPVGTIQVLSGLSPGATVFGLCQGPDQKMRYNEFSSLFHVENHHLRLGHHLCRRPHRLPRRECRPSSTPTLPSVTPTRFICSGPDGRLWFTQGDHLSAITTSGVVTLFPSIPGAPIGICAGPDGNLWFTDFQGAIGRSTPGGQITLFTGPLTQPSLPYAIAAGPDGDLWYGNIGGDDKHGVIVP